MGVICQGRAGARSSASRWHRSCVPPWQRPFPAPSLGSLCARAPPRWAPGPLLPEPKSSRETLGGKEMEPDPSPPALLSLPRVTALPRRLCLWSGPSSLWRLLRMNHSQMEFGPWHGLGGGQGGAFPGPLPPARCGIPVRPNHCCRSPGVRGCSLGQSFNPGTFELLSKPQRPALA